MIDNYTIIFLTRSGIFNYISIVAETMVFGNFLKF